MPAGNCCEFCPNCGKEVNSNWTYCGYCAWFFDCECDPPE